ncbi:ubiquitin carboxyl-terminal hydrolase 42-like [Morus bassanus]
MGNDSFIAEGKAPPQRILFPMEKICMAWQRRWGAGAGLTNLGNTCFLNSVLQCLTYTPPLANYLLSREHSQSCRQQGFCMMCRMEGHVNSVLRSSASTVQPWAVVSALTRIGEHFQLGMQEDAHEFLRYTVDAMQSACLSGRSDWAESKDGIYSQDDAVVPPCSGLPQQVSDCWTDASACVIFDHAYRRQLWCEQLVTASKRLTIHRPSNVLTVCLKRFDAFSGRKISKAVEYPEYLDLGAYTSEAPGESLLYSLYAVLVHKGFSCQAGHYYCFVKSSDGQWYKMDDDSVGLCDIETVLCQRAYLLFYAR